MNETAGDGREPHALGDGMAGAARRTSDRHRRWQDEGEASLLRFVGQIGVLGWIIVAPILIGLFLGRWLDLRLGSGVFWSAPLLMVGAAVGLWSAWRWMHRQ